MLTLFYRSSSFIHFCQQWIRFSVQFIYTLLVHVDANSKIWFENNYLEKHKTSCEKFVNIEKANRLNNGLKNVIDSSLDISRRAGLIRFCYFYSERISSSLSTWCYMHLLNNLSNPSRLRQHFKEVIPFIAPSNIKVNNRGYCVQTAPINPVFYL